MKADHLHKLNFLALPKFGKHQTTNQTILNHFPLVWSYGCTKHHSPGMNRKIWGTRLILRPSPEHCGFSIYSRKLDYKDTVRRSYRLVHTFKTP